MTKILIAICCFIFMVIVLFSITVFVAKLFYGQVSGGLDEELDSDITADSRVNRYKP